MYNTPAVLYGWVLHHTSVNFCRGVRKTVLDVTPLLTHLSLPPSLPPSISCYLSLSPVKFHC